MPNDIWGSAVTKVDEAQKYYRIYWMDMIWNYLSSMTNADGVIRFHRLARVAKLVLILMHQRRGFSAWLQRIGPHLDPI